MRDLSAKFPPSETEGNKDVLINSLHAQLFVK